MKKVLITAAVAALAVTTASAYNTQACGACHGADFEKKAMNVSKIVKDMSKDDIVKALKGYKDGTYGGAMKGVVAGQVKNLSDADIEAIATQIAGGEEKAQKAEAAPAEVAKTAEKAVKDAASEAKEKAGNMVSEAADKAVEKVTDTAKQKAAETMMKHAF
jgi:cytochrome c-type protein NapB